MQGDLEGLGKSDVENIGVCVRFREPKKSHITKDLWWCGKEGIIKI